MSEIGELIQRSVDARLQIERRSGYSTAWGKSVPVPATTTSFKGGDFLIRRGMPVVPELWCRGRVNVSLGGIIQDSERPRPDEIDVATHARFIPAVETFDSRSGTWNKYSGEANNWFFTSPPGSNPSIDDHAYRQGTELIIPDVLRYSRGDYSVGSFEMGTLFASEMTAYAAFMPLSADPGVLMHFPSGETTVGWNSGFYLKVGGTVRKISMPFHVTDKPVYYVILSIRLPRVSLTISTGPSWSVTITLNSKQSSWLLNMMIGKDEAPAASVFNLCELGFLNYEVRKVESDMGDYTINRLVSVMASMFGASE